MGSAYHFIVNFSAAMVLPMVFFSFWKISRRDEFKNLRESGQKINLNTYNLFSAYRRKKDDPLREAHIKLARIGFIHWAITPLVFLAIFIVATLVVYTTGES